ncbi:uncharacterized protein B0P05DRAFT_568808 [Gilbertella persicaria]|uniref:uncharacterized protein n=1 Tax=Gilbertella persicaria TaxID=101096 RepID=UPI00221E6A24|nr:uncharacterized protein B0P05DRAFT_568808 [Gilbertella persicaria]KAI8091443.1 hypothetical protein B0P05DRAFT_568808 [Gilbertella persicaria]
MTGNDDSTKKSKKFAVGDLPPSPTTSTGMVGTTKRPTRHHVKRRSSGRVHVSKLAPMARAHSDADTEKPIKRTQSNKSLSRLSTDRKPVGLTPAEPHSPPTTPPMTETNHKPNFHVSHTIPAAPIEQPLSVTADDLVTPDKKPLLKSQFVDKKTTLSNAAATTTGMTRTQQKLLLQREQSLIHDENHIAHPKNMIRLTREMEKMGREYRCVRKYQDPMMDSLIRCQQQKKPHLLHQRTMSSAQLAQNVVPHMEQRRQILLKAALQKQREQQEQQQQQQEEEESLLDGHRWSAGNFIERLFYGTL